MFPPSIGLSHLIVQVVVPASALLLLPLYGAVARTKDERPSAAPVLRICRALDGGQRSQPSSRAVGDYPLLFRRLLNVVQLLLGFSKTPLPFAELHFQVDASPAPDTAGSNPRERRRHLLSDATPRSHERLDFSC